MPTKHHLIVVGFDEIVVNKYLPCVQRAIQEGYLDAYSVIDLASERRAVERRLRAAAIGPRSIEYVTDCGCGQNPPAEDERLIASAFRRIDTHGLPTMVYIATEVKAHERYLRYCVENSVCSLVEKPVLAPMTGGAFDPGKITKAMTELIGKAKQSPARHSVMTLSRYHEVYNDHILAAVRERVLRWQAPLTSFHMKAAGGVWNLQREYDFREDHPYKYGYGMLMHGAYHYIDLAVQFLALNRAVYPATDFQLQVSSFGAFPTDQHLRMSRKIARRFGDDRPQWPILANCGRAYGETDITSAFRLIESQSGRTLTVGTLSFEQTTPSIRDWSRLPAGLYNKNGRTSSVDLEAQLATLYSTRVHCYDIPTGRNADKIDAFARVTSRANASLFPEESYVSEKTYEGLFHSDSNRALMENWLRGTETRSPLADHLLPMKITEALTTSLLEPGLPHVITF